MALAVFSRMRGDFPMTVVATRLSHTDQLWIAMRKWVTLQYQQVSAQGDSFSSHGHHTIRSTSDAPFPRAKEEGPWRHRSQPLESDHDWIWTPNFPILEQRVTILERLYPKFRDRVYLAR